MSLFGGMNLRQIECFVRIAELGSFTRASVLIGVPQPSLSRHIRLLEEVLKTPLFRRHGRGVALTPAGRSFLDCATTVLQTLQGGMRAVEEMRANPEGHLVIGLPSRLAGFAAAPLVRAFRSQFPRASITVAEGLSTTLQEWLLLGRINIAVLVDPLPSADLELEFLHKEELVLVGPSRAGSGKGAKGTSVAVKQLARFPLILPRIPNATRSAVERAAAKAGFRLNVTVEVDTVQNILELVAGRLGYAILPRSAVRKIGAKRVHVAVIHSPGLSQSLFLAVSSRQPKNALASHVGHIIRSSELKELFG